MLRAIAALFVTAIAVLSLAASLAASPFEDALAAHGRGDYATALRLYRPLAEQGDAGAQFNLGQMYGRGQGVAQNYYEAAKWFRLAADQGVGVAESNLAGC